MNVPLLLVEGVKNCPIFIDLAQKEKSSFEITNQICLMPLCLLETIQYRLVRGHQQTTHEKKNKNDYLRS
jgi:hypothetical protein